MQNGIPAEVLNTARFDALTSDRGVPKQQVITIFMDNARECLSVMRWAYANNDNELWSSAVIELGSLADVLGAEALYSTASANANSSIVQEREKCESAIHIITAEVEKIRNHIAHAK